MGRRFSRRSKVKCLLVDGLTWFAIDLFTKKYVFFQIHLKINMNALNCSWLFDIYFFNCLNISRNHHENMHIANLHSSECTILFYIIEKWLSWFPFSTLFAQLLFLNCMPVFVVCRLRRAGPSICRVGRGGTKTNCIAMKKRQICDLLRFPWATAPRHRVYYIFSANLNAARLIWNGHIQ